MKHATQRHWKKLALLTLATLAIPTLLLWTSTLAQVKKPITKDGLVEAIRLKGFSTKELIKQIETRGVSFQMTSEIEAEMRGAGAQPELIEAVRSNYRPDDGLPGTSFSKGAGALTINAQPGSKVFVNGKLRGMTNDGGVFTLSPLKAGAYNVALKKDNYEDQERSVVVLPGVETAKLFTLSPVKGQLTVTPDIPGARVTLDGVEYPTGISNLSVPAATYEVKVSKPGYRTFTKTIAVAPRGSFTVEASLQPVPAEELLAQTISYFQAQRYREAISSGQGILALHPNSPQALMLTGLAYYYSAQYSDSIEYLSKAITVGEQVILPIRHHHRAFLDDALCSGRITIGRGMLSFTSIDKTGHDFSVPANKIYELTFEPRKYGRVHVQVGIPKGSKEDKKTYNFHVSHTGTRLYDPNSRSSITVLYCNDCEQETQVVYQLLRQLKDVPYQPSNAPQPNEGGAGLPTLKRRLTQLESDDGAPGRPTLTRRPPSSSDAGVEPKAGRDPELAFAGRENFQAGGRNWTRYKVTVTNRTAYSDDMFASAADLPPCGFNTKASRTWVDIFDRAGKRLNGFCALNSSDGLVSLWFALPAGQAPPSEVFIVITDRLSKKEYKSNLAAIP